MTWRPIFPTSNTIRAAAAPNVNLREDNSNAGYRMGKTNIGKLEINRDSFGWRSYQPA
jgi:hypothetical protein